MSRAVLRLVEPLGDALEFPEGKSESTGLREITFIDEVHSHLQLFLMWPDYSSSFIKVADEMMKASISIDQGLSEFDQLFISIEENALNRIKQDKSTFERVYIEVFGITFGFKPKIQECIGEYTEGMPCISLELPDAITRYNMRGSRRVRLQEPLNLSILDNGNAYTAKLIDVSPNAFCIKLSEKDKNVKLSDRVSFCESGNSFDGLVTSSINHSIIIKPLTEEARHFGGFFDLYVKCAYPQLRSRYSFSSDPVPELLYETGQVKKFAAKEESESWIKDVSATYSIAKEVKDTYIADYIAIDEHGKAIGTSSLAKVFIDGNGHPLWAFHGVGIVQDPKYLPHTCSLYNWRSDYILARTPQSNIVVWFDGRGKWIEKVYSKFFKLTSDVTQLWPVRSNRYVKIRNTSDIADVNIKSRWKFEKCVNKNDFKRIMISDENASIGIGVPYLNYAGFLDNLFFRKKTADYKKVFDKATDTVRELKPNRFYIPNPSEHEDPHFENYESYCLESVNRQCITTGDALKFFSSSLEHSQAIVRKKYGKR